MTRDLIGLANTFFTAFLATCAVMYVPAAGRSVWRFWRARHIDVNRWSVRFEFISGSFWMIAGLAGLFIWMARGRLLQAEALNSAASYGAFPPEWGLIVRLAIAYGFIRMMRSATRESCGERCWLSMVAMASVAGAYVAYLSER